jgi:hypothetical protein
MELSINEEITLGFDPAESSDKKVREIFSNKTAYILWCLIKTQHIVSQYFNENVLAVAKTIEEKKPENYRNFMQIINSSPLSGFGNIVIQENFMYSEKIPDSRFWSNVFKKIIKNCYFKVFIEIEGEEKREFEYYKYRKDYEK